MPQMSPLYWTLIMIMTLFFLMMTFTFIYTIKIQNIKILKLMKFPNFKFKKKWY